MPEGIPCFKCLSTAEPENLIPCFCCKLLFHSNCIGATDRNRPDTWICLICKTSAGSALTPTLVSTIYRGIEENPDTPLSSSISSLLSWVRSLSHEINGLRKELESLKESRSDLSMSSSDTQGKEKRTLIFGNDINLVCREVKQLLPKEAKISTIPYKSASMEKMVSQALKTISEAKDVADFHVYVHPGAEECLLRESKKLVSHFSQFVQTIKEQLPNTKITVMSVPQVIDDHCEAVNASFQQMAEANLVNYLSMTKIQSDLCFQRLRAYDDKIASRVARVVAANIAEQSGIKLVHTDPRKGENDGRHTYQVRNASQQRRGSVATAGQDARRQVQEFVQSKKHRPATLPQQRKRNGSIRRPQYPSQRETYYVSQVPTEEESHYRNTQTPQWNNRKGQQKRGASPYFPQGKRRQIMY